MVAASAFVDLRRLVDWFETAPERIPLHIQRTAQRLGTAAVPLLGRQLCSDHSERRDLARSLLLGIAHDHCARRRVIRELQRIAASDTQDSCKVSTLGLLAELGERSTARFADPNTVQRNSAIAFAAQLDSPEAVASAAAIVVRQLPDDAMIALLEAVAIAAPDRAARLVGELCCRHDVAAGLRARLMEVAPPSALPVKPSSEADLPTRVVLLERTEPAGAGPGREGAARRIVVAARKVGLHRRWRVWAVLIGTAGHIDDCMYEAASPDAEAMQFIARLRADGYVASSAQLDDVRTLVARAARRSLAPNRSSRPEHSTPFPCPYYLGRDLLDLGTVHVSPKISHRASTLLDRALERIASNEIARALLLLAHCDALHPDVAAALAACALAEGAWGLAKKHLRRAIETEPTWPLHYWNLFVALHRLGDTTGCNHALAKFVAASAVPSGLDADPDQKSRVACAKQLLFHVRAGASTADASNAT